MLSIIRIILLFIVENYLNSWTIIINSKQKKFKTVEREHERQDKHKMMSCNLVVLCFIIKFIKNNLKIFILQTFFLLALSIFNMYLQPIFKPGTSFILYLFFFVIFNEHKIFRSCVFLILRVNENEQRRQMNKMLGLCVISSRCSYSLHMYNNNV